ncbi:dihydroorotase [Desulfonema ishimotonii]|uniref:Dihydroorotase n=1 Tax=Desulfonema ishimotonii TaxID=45657 RepID=A0A401FTU6_9BACT|nr:dihydroorotase [Desulfonema ishimotonii]GBC60374.1 dihydroorotase [Desulfonema ishimotonii]
MRILIRGGWLLDPGHSEGVADILVEGGRIADIRAGGMADVRADRVIHAAGKIVTPGLIDMHVHFREPGQEHKETIESGCLAAAAGGFTAVCTMPNTQPANDSPQVTASVLEKAGAAGTVSVWPVGAISRALKGERLCDYGELRAAGVIALSDDGMPVMNSLLMRRAMAAAKAAGLPVISHSEDLDLVADGVMNEGETASGMGLPGIPNAAESIAVMREIALCELTGAPLHIAHVSTAESVRAIRAAKGLGIPVTAETAPHYFTLTDAAVLKYGTNAKMNPPLRSEADRQAIRQGLADGTIDVIATDHAPHAVHEKNVRFEKAPNGIIGLETSLPISLRLVEDGVLTMAQLIEKMAVNPARILGLDNRLKTGNAADITIIDPGKAHTIRAEHFRSLSRNTPFDGWNVTGKAVLTLAAGKIVFEDL